MIALQHLLSVRRFQIQMTVSLQRHAASARRAAEKTDLHEIRLINIFQGDRFFCRWSQPACPVRPDRRRSSWMML